MTRICVLLDNPFVNDSRVQRHIESLTRHGYEIVLVCPKTRAMTEETADSRTNGSFTIQRFEWPRRKRGPTSRWGHRAYAVWDLLAYGGPMVPMIRSMIEEGEKLDFDLIYANDLPTLEPAYRLGRKKSVPILYDAHEICLEQLRKVYRPSVKPNWKRALLRKFSYHRTALIERLILPRVDMFLTVNPLIEDYYRKRHRLRNTGTVLNVPPRALRQRESIGVRSRLGVSENARIAAYHGLIAKGRGVFELAEAAQYLPDHIHILLIGHGSAWRELEELVERYPRKNLHVLPTIPYDRLITSLREIDLSVVPIHKVSLSYYLSSPNKLFESLLAGVPLLVPDYPYMSKLVRETGMGRILEEDITPQNLARNIQAFFDDPNFCDRLEYESPYVWENEEKRLLDAVASLAPADS